MRSSAWKLLPIFVAITVFGLNQPTTSAAIVQWSGNGHWYELVFDISTFQTFGQAESEAQNRSHLGMDGYLATITSAGEKQFIDDFVLAPNAFPLGGQKAWIGGSDVSTEGAWRWIHGPEGLEDGGLGRQFWQSDLNPFFPWNGSTTEPDQYANWVTFQPGTNPEVSDFLA
ncbi:MAG: hypothetical protein RJP95_00345, partial [Pirellulales bacterium]